MRKYSEAQIQTNRQTIVKGALLVLGVIVVITAVGLLSVGQLVGSSVVVVLFAAAFWWLFASRSAGSIDDSWVDGWTFRIKR